MSETPIESFKMESKTFTDPRDGKVYKTVKIGEQVWMAENLNFECEGSKCYDDDPSNAEIYGRLYDWVTAMKVCPPGWHLPSKEEGVELVDFAGGREIAGKKLKAKSGWNESWKGMKISKEDLKGREVNGTDEYGFSALPGGYTGFNECFFFGGEIGYWWTGSSSDDAGDWGKGCAYRLNMHNLDDKALFIVNSYKFLLHSVRCIQDKARRDVV